MVEDVTPREDIVKVETVPLILGALVALLALGLLLDAWIADRGVADRERRRRPRAERHRGGEALVGVGALCMAAALIGRDTWDYGIVATIAGAVCLLAGALLNHRYLGELLSNRGALRRGLPDSARQNGDAPAAAASRAAAPAPPKRTPTPKPSPARRASTSGERARPITAVRADTHVGETTLVDPDGHPPEGAEPSAPGIVHADDGGAPAADNGRPPAPGATGAAPGTGGALGHPRPG